MCNDIKKYQTIVDFVSTEIIHLLSSLDFTGVSGIYKASSGSNGSEFEADPCLGSEENSSTVVAASRLHPWNHRCLLVPALQRVTKRFSETSQQFTATSRDKAQ